MTHRTSKWWWLPGGSMLWGAFCFLFSGVISGKGVFLVIGLSFLAIGIGLLTSAKALRQKQQEHAAQPPSTDKGGN